MKQVSSFVQHEIVIMAIADAENVCCDAVSRTRFDKALDSSFVLLLRCVIFPPLIERLFGKRRGGSSVLLNICDSVIQDNFDESVFATSGHAAVRRHFKVEAVFPLVHNVQQLKS
eukprot:13479_5